MRSNATARRRTRTRIARCTTSRRGACRCCASTWPKPKRYASDYGSLFLAGRLDLCRELDEHLRVLVAVELRHREVTAALQAAVGEVHGARLRARLLPDGCCTLDRRFVHQAHLRRDEHDGQARIVHEAARPISLHRAAVLVDGREAGWQRGLRFPGRDQRGTVVEAWLRRIAARRLEAD